MKNTVKLFGIIALVAVIGFSFASCDGGGGGGGGNGNGPPSILPGPGPGPGTGLATVNVQLFRLNEGGYGSNYWFRLVFVLTPSNQYRELQGTPQMATFSGFTVTPGVPHTLRLYYSSDNRSTWQFIGEHITRSDDITGSGNWGRNYGYFGQPDPYADYAAIEVQNIYDHPITGVRVVLTGDETVVLDSDDVIASFDFYNFLVKIGRIGSTTARIYLTTASGEVSEEITLFTRAEDSGSPVVNLTHDGTIDIQ